MSSTFADDASNLSDNLPPSRSAPTPAMEALLVLAVTQLMIVLDVTIVNVALPSIQDSFGFSSSSIAWVINGYILAFGALLLLGARTGDRLGRRRVFLASLITFGIASLVGGLAPSPGILVAARLVQGAAAAFAQANALSLIVSTFAQGSARNRALAVFAAMEGIGASAGLILGGVLVQAVSWHWVFLVNVPIAIAMAILTPRFLPETPRQRTRVDIPGTLVGTAGLAALVFGLMQAAERGWSDAVTLVILGLGLAGLALFVAIEWRSPTPLMPLWVFRNRDRAGAYVLQALVGAGLFGMFFLMTTYLQRILGLTAMEAGLAFLPTTLGLVAAAEIVSRFVARTGVRPLAAAGTALAAFGLFLLSRLSANSTYLDGVLVPTVLLAVGLGLTFVPVMIAAVSGVDEQYSGLVSGIATTAIQIGGAIGVAILVLGRRHHDDGPADRYAAGRDAHGRLHTGVWRRLGHARSRRPDRSDLPAPPTPCGGDRQDTVILRPTGARCYAGVNRGVIRKAERRPQAVRAKRTECPRASPMSCGPTPSPLRDQEDHSPRSNRRPAN